MTKEEAGEAVREAYGNTEYTEEIIKALEQEPRWIPIVTRHLTDEERKEYDANIEFIYDCLLPDDGQDVLITDCYGNVEEDTFCRDCEGVYFETNCDDGEVIAWMPLPQPYKADKEDEQ